MLILSTLHICLEPNRLAKTNEIEHDKKSAMEIITRPWTNPNWYPEATENIVPGKTGIIILIDLSKNNKNISIGLKNLYEFKLQD